MQCKELDFFIRRNPVDVLPGLKAGASTPPDGSAVAPAGPRPFLPALNGGAPRAFLVVPPAGRRVEAHHHLQIYRK